MAQKTRSKDAQAGLAEVLGRNLKSCRDLKGWTQDKAAEECGVSLSYYAALEGGRKEPSLPTLARLARVLDTTASRLLR